MNRFGFCIYINTVCQGPVPVEHDERGYPVVYASREEAEREIATDLIERLQQFLNDEREFDDAMTVEEYVAEVDVLPDGSVIDEEGNHFSAVN
jgi:hypothetical protein